MWSYYSTQHNRLIVYKTPQFPGGQSDVNKLFLSNQQLKTWRYSVIYNREKQKNLKFEKLKPANLDIFTWLMML